MEQRKSGTGGSFIIFGVILAIASVVAFLSGTSYTGNFQNVASAGLSSLMGKQDATYGNGENGGQFFAIYSYRGHWADSCRSG